MQVKTYPTHLLAPQEDLFSVLDAYLPPLPHQSIVVITSKVVSLTEGSLMKKKDASSKEELAKSLSDAYLEHSILTFKHHLLIPFAGIDESNIDASFYILPPRNPQKSAQEIWSYLRKKNPNKEIGVLITDSHTTPFRKGVIGKGLAWCGFRPLYSYLGKTDCFGRLFTSTQINVVDALAASSVFCMGEGDESTPLALLSNLPKAVEFQTTPPSPEDIQAFFLSFEEDLYAPLLKQASWVFCQALSTTRDV